MARGDIAYIDLPKVEGRHEQGGRRPAVLVIATTALQDNSMRMVVPLTSNRAAARFPFTFEVQPSVQNGLSAPSIALVFQLRAIDRIFVGSIVGHLEDEYMTRIDEMMRQMLGL